jgi:hypothetical protein
MTQITKTQQVRDLLARGEDIAALRIAKGFRILGEHKADIQRGWDAHTNPRFARSLGRDPDELVARAINSLRTLYPV